MFQTAKAWLQEAAGIPVQESSDIPVTAADSGHTSELASQGDKRASAVTQEPEGRSHEQATEDERITDEAFTCIDGGKLAEEEARESEVSFVNVSSSPAESVNDSATHGRDLQSDEASCAWNSEREKGGVQLDDYESVQRIQDSCDCKGPETTAEVEYCDGKAVLSPASTQASADMGKATGAPSDMGKVSGAALAVSRVFHEIKSALTSVQHWAEAGHRPDAAVDCGEEPIWLLGTQYKEENKEIREGASSESHGDVSTQSASSQFFSDWSSRILITYRKDFPPIGTSSFTTDVGWGCMVRSAQMMLAQVILQHRLGREWRWAGPAQASEKPADVVRLFHDSPQAPLSLHQFFSAAQRQGLEPGAWLGPYAVCTGLRSLCSSAEASRALGMPLHIVTAGGKGLTGGVPVLCVEDVEAEMREWRGQGLNESSLEGEAGAGSPRALREVSAQESAMLAGTGVEGMGVDARGGASQSTDRPILLLVPLVLGVDSINPRYLPSLKAVFTFPQCVGMLGGKPGSSTYLVGVQDDLAFYLDPHCVQPVVQFDLGSSFNVSTYRPFHINQLSFDDLDPSLALGFYCKDSASFLDLCTRLEELARTASGAPLLIVSPERLPCVEPETGDALKKDESGSDDDWEMI